MLESADIVIVGGGCAGRSVAFQAAKLQHGLKIIHSLIHRNTLTKDSE